MNKWRIYLVCLLGALHLSAFAEDEPRRVYLFGVATNFNDSTVYLTDVQHLDSIMLNPDGSLPNYVGYALQLKVHLEGSLDERDQTCAVIYSDKKKKLEKRFLAVRKRYSTNKEKMVKQVGSDEFRFQKR